MSFPIAIQFRGIEASDALRTRIEEHARRLNRCADDIRSCRVAISAECHPHHAGDRYRIDVHLVVGGQEIHAGDAHTLDPRHDDAYAAVADAFSVARRCIENRIQRRRTTRRRRTSAKTA